jgi:hypothetical protein
MKASANGRASSSATSRSRSLITHVGPGSTGDAVRAVQVLFPQLTVDGSFGADTAATVMSSRSSGA